jgi:NDP-4-keto-2,6-dideoxyhexose 3-C-methyltransferase
MEHSYDLGEMYGDNYGYRSGLNSSMVAHLQRKVARIESLIPLLTGDLIIDIGSNDSTTLRAYSGTGCDLVGIDPTGTKFQKYYPPHVTLIPDFFSSSLLKERFPGRKAKVVTSFSMFYDLEAPMEFMREVFDVLADDGVWVFEQSYMPTMLSANSFDTACHEHLEYYALKQIKWMADRVGLTIVDLEFNDVNGGSFSVTVAKTASGATESPAVARALEEEARLGLDALEPYRQFAQRVEQARAELVAFVRDANAAGQTVAAIGASTKGNVLLQYCGFDTSQLSSVGEVNPEKYGCFTPGTLLPIVPEADLLADPPDFLLVLPWHFKSYFCSAERYKGHTLVFPLPKLEIVHC